MRGETGRWKQDRKGYRARSFKVLTSITFITRSLCCCLKQKNPSVFNMLWVNQPVFGSEMSLLHTYNGERRWQSLFVCAGITLWRVTIDQTHHREFPRCTSYCEAVGLYLYSHPRFSGVDFVCVFLLRSREPPPIISHQFWYSTEKKVWILC